MKNKRIVIFGWADSVHVQRWCTGLAKSGFAIKLISIGGKPINTIETVILPRRGKLSYLTNLLKAKREAKSFSPDLIHVHYVAGNGLMGWWTKKHPLVSSVWGSDIDTAANSWPINLITAKVLRASDHITVTSRFLKTQTEKVMGHNRQPISIIPFGVTLPDKTTPLSPLRPFKICYLKTHKHVYGGDNLIRALSIVIKDVPDVTLTLAGNENDYTLQLKKIAAECNLEKHVSFAGFINHDEVYSFISEHHLLVMPSRSEGFGVAALEASVCKRPVVASHVGGVPEVVINGQTGILVPPNDPMALADAILKLANNIELCHNMGEAGHEFVKKNYNWDKSLDQMSELYERLINESRKN